MAVLPSEECSPSLSTRGDLGTGPVQSASHFSFSQRRLSHMFYLLFIVDHPELNYAPPTQQEAPCHFFALHITSPPRPTATSPLLLSMTSHCDQQVLPQLLYNSNYRAKSPDRVPTRHRKQITYPSEYNLAVQYFVYLHENPATQETCFPEQPGSYTVQPSILVINPVNNASVNVIQFSALWLPSASNAN